MTHPLAWTLWLLAALGAVLSTRNPLYLGLILAGSAALARRRLFSSLWLMLPLAALFNALLTRAGNTVWWHLPFSSAPVTAEALVYGALNGLVLLTLLTVFQTFSTVLRPRDLLYLTPRAFYGLALTVTLALTYLPLVQRQARQIWEAQLIRGQRMRGWRAWGPLLLPLLIGSLERSFALAEALAARGFILSTPQPRLRFALGLSLALIGLLGMLLWTGATAALLVGLGLMGWELWRVGQSAPRTSYHPYFWTWADTAGVLGAALALMGLLLDATRLYTPYPVLSLPPFAPAVGLALMGLSLPLVLPERPRD